MNARKNLKKNKEGFAMLFAVLTASLLLTIGLSIFNISFKELLISTNSRESQIAFFAADSARECALYWDIKNGAFPVCSDADSGCINPKIGEDFDLNKIKCNGEDTHLSRTNYPSQEKSIYNNDSAFSFIKYGNDLEPEASVIITKIYDDTNTNISTTIEAIGHNTVTKGRRLERSIKQTSL